MSILSSAGRRIAVAGIGAAIAATTLGAGAAQAGIPARLPTAPITFHLPTIDELAPTADLATLAKAVDFHIKSVSSEITLPPGRILQHPIDVSVQIDTPTGVGAPIYKNPPYPANPVNASTQAYSTTFGNDWLYQFPENQGNRYDAPVTVNFVEHITATKTETFSRTWFPTVEPLYNVFVSPLKFTLRDDCDTWGDSEIKVDYRDPTGALRNWHVNARAGYTTSFATARWYYQVGQSTNLRQPGASWLEHDPQLVDVGDASSPTLANGFNLATHPGFTTVINSRDANGQSCRAQLSYSVTKHLDTFGSFN